jgi:hypothetical protein
MIPAKYLAVIVLAGLVAAGGCGSASSAAKQEAPLKTSEGADKKGHKTPSASAEFEVPK